MKTCDRGFKRETADFQSAGVGAVPTYRTIEIKPIDVSSVNEWFLKKHYAHRIPRVSYAFGLFIDKILSGVCTFGSALPMQLKRGICGKEYESVVFELNRLCVNDGLERNTLSRFVSGCLKLLPNPMIIVSYADMAQNHHGYIYQATNFIYTGVSHVQLDWKIKGKENIHSRTLMDEFPRTKGRIKLLKEKYGDLMYQEIRPQKHRYIYFLGKRGEIKNMLKNLRYPKVDYPKGLNSRYDSTHRAGSQISLL